MASYRGVLIKLITKDSQEAVVKGVESMLTPVKDEDDTQEQQQQYNLTAVPVEKENAIIKYAFLPLENGYCYQVIVNVRYVFFHPDEKQPIEYEVAISPHTTLSITTHDHVPNDFIPTILNFTDNTKKNVIRISNLRLPHHLMYDIPEDHYTVENFIDYDRLFPDGEAVLKGKNFINGYIVTRKNTIGRVYEVVDYCLDDVGNVDYVVDSVYIYNLDAEKSSTDAAAEPLKSVTDFSGRIRDPILRSNGYYVLCSITPGGNPMNVPFKTLPEFQKLFRRVLESVVDEWALERGKVERIFTTSRGFFYGFANDEKTYKKNAALQKKSPSKDHSYYFDSNIRCRISVALDEDFLELQEQTITRGNWVDPWAPHEKADTFGGAFPDFEEYDRPHNHAILFGKNDANCAKHKGSKLPFRFFAEKEAFADGFGAFLSFIQTRGQHDLYKNKSTDQEVFNMCKSRTFKWNSEIGFYTWSTKRTKMTVWASLIRAYLALGHGIKDPVVIHFMHKYMPAAYAHYKTCFEDIHK